MDLLEHQARELFRTFDVPVLPGIVATTPEQAAAARDTLGADVVVVKAQVRTGGRGKAGGVKLARGRDEVVEVARAILGMEIKGHTVEEVLVCPAAEIAEEYYFSILLDRAAGGYLAMCSRQGGMDIETLAVEQPEALVRLSLDVTVGIDEAVGKEIAARAGFPEADHQALAQVFVSLWQLFHDVDATLVEVNPLVKLADGSLSALDGKVTLDDNADFRHEWGSYHASSGETELERQARDLGLNYVHLSGSVGIIGNGAGLVMSTLDVVERAGRELPGAPRPANFLDIGGGASSQVMANGLRIIMSDPQVRSVFVNVFGGITACNDVATGIVHALELLGDEARLPIVVRLDGNSVEVGRAILDEAAHPLIRIEDTMDQAAATAARLASAH